MTMMLVQEDDTYSPVYFHGKKFWTRFSGQIYLEMRDFEKGAQLLVLNSANTGESPGHPPKTWGNRNPKALEP